MFVYVCVSVRIKRLGSYWIHLHDSLHWGLLMEPVDMAKSCSKLDKSKMTIYTMTQREKSLESIAPCAVSWRGPSGVAVGAKTWPSDPLRSPNFWI
jgi:hypothetical protein